MNFKHSSSKTDRVVWSVRSLVLMMFALHLVAVTVAAPAANLIPSLPGQPPVSFKQYGGYITVDQSHGRKLFYYFVEAANSSATAPLILWLNGGPGCSSLGGAFTELGPFRPNSTGDGLMVNNYSWNQVANIIFLESPAGVGFSYSKNTSDYTTGDDKTAQDSLAFLFGWLAEYPEYNSTDFYVTGESYGGHYIPQLAAAILKNNNVPGQAQIRLKGIMAGNPLLDLYVDTGYAYFEYAWSHGMIDEDTHNTLLNDCNWTATSQSVACTTAANTALWESNTTSLNDYDVIQDICVTGGQQSLRLKAWTNVMFQQYSQTAMPEDSCIADELTTYLRRYEVVNAMHAEVSGWTQCSNVLSYNQTDVYTPMAPVLEELLKSTLRIWIYSGDADMTVSLIGTRQIITTLAKNLNLNTTSVYRPWSQGSQIGGWTVSWGSLVLSTVRAAGHMVPATQPASALQLITSFLAGDPSPPLTPL